MKKVKPGYCVHCGKKITLSPTAAERARKHGGKPSDYTRMFIAHSECTLKWRANLK